MKYQVFLILILFFCNLTDISSQEKNTLDKRFFDKNFKRSPLAEKLLEIYKGVPTNTPVLIDFPSEVKMEHQGENYQNAWEELIICKINEIESGDVTVYLIYNALSLYNNPRNLSFLFFLLKALLALPYDQTKNHNYYLKNLFSILASFRNKEALNMILELVDLMNHKSGLQFSEMFLSNQIIIVNNIVICKMTFPFICCNLE